MLEGVPSLSGPVRVSGQVQESTVQPSKGITSPLRHHTGNWQSHAVNMGYPC